MKRRSMLATIVLAFVPAAGVPAAGAAPSGQLFPVPSASAGSDVIEIARRGSGPRLLTPIAPSYLYYDYPYYYRRGFYPTHVGPGFLYYGYPYTYYTRSRSRGYGGRCSGWRRGCSVEWNYHRGPRR